MKGLYERGYRRADILELFRFIEVLSLRFQSIPQELVDQIQALTSLDRLKGLLRQAVIAGTVEEFEQTMEADETRSGE